MSRFLKDASRDCRRYRLVLFRVSDEQNAILAGKYRDALDHYLMVGIRDGRLPMEPDVDEMWYRRPPPAAITGVTRKV